MTIAPLLAALLAAAAPAAPAPRPVAQPVAQAERDFAAFAQQFGQWTAFRQVAAPGAFMLAPGIVSAASFLEGRPDPKSAIAWTPARTITACDGSYAFSTGAWTRDGGAHGGRFYTIWQMQPDGHWRWLFDGGTTDKADATPAQGPTEELTTACDAPADAADQSGKDAGEAGGAATDGSLKWRFVRGEGKDAQYRLHVDYWSDGAWKTAADTLLD